MKEQLTPPPGLLLLNEPEENLADTPLFTDTLGTSQRIEIIRNSLPVEYLDGPHYFETLDSAVKYIEIPLIKELHEYPLDPSHTEAEDQYFKTGILLMLKWIFPPHHFMHRVLKELDQFAIRGYADVSVHKYNRELVPVVENGRIKNISDPTVSFARLKDPLQVKRNLLETGREGGLSQDRIFVIHGKDTTLPTPWMIPSQIALEAGVFPRRLYLSFFDLRSALESGVLEFSGENDDMLGDLNAPGKTEALRSAHIMTVAFIVPPVSITSQLTALERFNAQLTMPATVPEV